jgi:hypothetical protein
MLIAICYRNTVKHYVITTILSSPHFLFNIRINTPTIIIIRIESFIQDLIISVPSSLSSMMEESSSHSHSHSHPPHHPQLLAMKLNNRAVSLLITQGKYEEGITMLTKALKLTRIRYNNKTPTLTKPTNKASSLCCKSFTFQSCLLMDDDTYYSSLLLTEEEHRHYEDHQDQHEVLLHQGESQYYHQRITTKTNELLLHSMNMNMNMNINKIESTATTTICIDYNDEEMKCFSESSSDSSLLQDESAQSYCYHSTTSTGQAQHDTTQTHQNSNGFVYRRPILIDRHCIDEMHCCSN